MVHFGNFSSNTSLKNGLENEKEEWNCSPCHKLSDFQSSQIKTFSYFQMFDWRIDCQKTSDLVYLLFSNYLNNELISKKDHITKSVDFTHATSLFSESYRHKKR